MPTTFLGTSPPTRDELITPEAAVIDLRVAGLGSRMGASCIDFSIKIIWITAFTVAGGSMATSDWLFYAVALFGWLFGLIGYDPFFETVFRGKSPGKAALGLRVVTVEGAPIRFRHAFIRSVIGLFEILGTSGALAILVMAFTRRTQRLGDMVAGTLVFRERQALRRPKPVFFNAPSGTEDLMSRLDTTGLAPSDYSDVRSFLIRAPKLIPSARTTLASAIVGLVQPRLSVKKPVTMPDEVFLTCIAASYQARFRR